MGPAEQLYLAVQHTGRALRRLDDELGLTPARFSALATLRYAGPQRVGELAALEGVAQPTMTRLVGKLEDEGLVVREHDAADGRGSVVALTGDGRALVRRARARKIAWVARAIREVRPEDLDALADSARLLDVAALRPPAGRR
jgi:DNA-binding MarR family transcriptional regulator